MDFQKNGFPPFFPHPKIPNSGSPPFTRDNFLKLNFLQNPKNMLFFAFLLNLGQNGTMTWCIALNIGKNARRRRKN